MLSSQFRLVVMSRRLDREMEINRDLPTAITAKPSRDVPRFVPGSLWWVLPPAAALLYPLTVGALYESGKLHPASVVSLK